MHWGGKGENVWEIKQHWKGKCSFVDEAVLLHGITTCASKDGITGIVKRACGNPNLDHAHGEARSQEAAATMYYTVLYFASPPL